MVEPILVQIPDHNRKLFPALNLTEDLRALVVKCGLRVALAIADEAEVADRRLLVFALRCARRVFKFATDNGATLDPVTLTSLATVEQYLNGHATAEDVQQAGNAARIVSEGVPVLEIQRHYLADIGYLISGPPARAAKEIGRLTGPLHALCRPGQVSYLISEEQAQERDLLEILSAS